MRSGASRRLQAHLDTWVESRDVSSAFGLVSRSEEVVWEGAASEGGSRPTRRTLFDLASLTKPLMATLALLLDQRGTLRLGTSIASIWPQCSPGLSKIELESLLRHRARFRAWYPLYHLCRSPAEVTGLLLDGSLLGARLGTYSDLGYILWGLAVEERCGAKLETVARDCLLEPLGLPGVQALPGNGPGVEACHCDNSKEVQLAGEMGIDVPARGAPRRGRPQDGNARFLGGLAGHAGLFGCADSLLRFAGLWLSAVAGRRSVLSRTKARAALEGRGTDRLGWARPRVRGSAGTALGPRGFGHVGFTGTSLWIDPDRDSVLILLAQRKCAFSDLDLRRRRFHRLAAERLGSRSAARP